MPESLRLLLLLLCLPATAHAARPFVTDDARVVDENGCQIETFRAGVSLDRDEGAFLRA